MKEKIIKIIDNLNDNGKINKKEILLLLTNLCDSENTKLSKIEIESLQEYLREKAYIKSHKIFGNKVYMRGLIEFSNYCKNDCIYCGIRKSNKNAQRYRLSKDDILECCDEGYKLGFRTFVLQSGEDMFFTKKRIVDITSSIKNKYPDCALTLSIGEKSYDYYKAIKESGVNRFLLRHETSTEEHYNKLHPKELLLKKRLECLKIIKELGFQTGTGIMVGSPFQTINNITNDLIFIKKLKPEMIGIGPFLPHEDTPFKDKDKGSINTTLILISILRLLFPFALIPSTTALGTISKNGRERGILAGANVVMPNLSPLSVRKKYSLYNDKICTDEEAMEGLELLRAKMLAIGYEITGERGDHIKHIFKQ